MMKLEHMEEWVKFLGEKNAHASTIQLWFLLQMLLKSWEMGLGDKLQLVLRDGAPDFLGWQLLVVAMAVSLQEDPCRGCRAWLGWDGLGSVPWLLSKVGWANFPCLRMVALYYSLSLPHVWCTIWRLQNQTTFGFLWGHLSFMAFSLYLLNLSTPLSCPAFGLSSSCLPLSPGKNQMRIWHESGILVYPGRFGMDCREGAENSNDRRLEPMPLSFPMKRATVWLGWGTLESGQAGRTCKGCGTDSGIFMPGRESEVCRVSSLESLRIFWVRHGGIISDLNTSSGWFSSCPVPSEPSPDC